MEMYEKYKELLKGCIKDAETILEEVFGKPIHSVIGGAYGYDTVIQLAIKLADIKIVAEEIE